MPMIQVKRGEGESVLSLIKRFAKKVKESGNLKLAKERMFKSRPKSDLKKKLEALKREEKRKEIERLKKLGKIS